MYATLETHSDITYSVQVLSRFSKNSKEVYQKVVKRVFHYLKGTQDLWLTCGGAREELTRFADADGNIAEDCHTILGYAFIINSGAISQSAKRQEIVTLSTTESKYISTTHAAKEAVWLCSLISQVFKSILLPITLFSDNKSAIALAKDHQYHAYTKYIDIHYYFIHWIITEGKIQLIYYTTENIIADVFTKALPSPKVKNLLVNLASLQFEEEYQIGKLAIMLFLVLSPFWTHSLLFLLVPSIIWQFRYYSIFSMDTNNYQFHIHKYYVA